MVGDLPSVAGADVAGILCPPRGPMEADAEKFRDHDGGHLASHIHQCCVAAEGGVDADGS